jgi:hypothetical protein
LGGPLSCYWAIARLPPVRNGWLPLEKFKNQPICMDIYWFSELYPIISDFGIVRAKTHSSWLRQAIKRTKL